MRAFTATALTLAGAALAAPAASDASSSSAKFQLRVVNNDHIFGWALINAHVAAGQNVIQIQRPSVYQSDVSYIEDSSLFFDLNSAPLTYALTVPEVPAGTVGLVTSEIGTGTTGFSLNANNYLVYNGNVEGWWACPVDNTFELFYGVNPDPANLPSDKCEAFELSAGFV